MGRLSECFDRLSEGMTENQRMGRENFKDYLLEVSVISEREMFEYGLWLGMRLMVGVMAARGSKISNEGANGGTVFSVGCLLFNYGND